MLACVADRASATGAVNQLLINFTSHSCFLAWMKVSEDPAQQAALLTG